MFINELNPIRRQLLAGVRYFAGESSGGGGSASGKTSDNPSGKETDGLIVDIDFSDVPENIREQVKAKVASKAKQFQTDYTKKTTSMATEKKLVETEKEKLELIKRNLGEWNQVIEDLNTNPQMATKLRKVYQDLKTGKISESSATAEKGLKTLDKLIDNATDGDSREDLRRLRTIIREEAEVGTELRDEVKTLKDQLTVIASATRSVQTDRASRGIQELSDRFGGELVGNYKDKIITAILKYPQRNNETFQEYSESIFLNVANSEDRKKAILFEAKEQEKKETERKKKGLMPEGEDIKAGIQLKRDEKTGKVDVRGAVRQVLQKAGIK